MGKNTPMTIFFTSDLHFNHKAMVRDTTTGEPGWRPFDTLDDLNRTIIDRWNSVVEDNDIVYVLGDVCMGKRTDTLPLVRELAGTKFLIPGNHDNCWEGLIYPQVIPEVQAKQRAKVDGWREKYLELGGFEDILPSQVRVTLISPAGTHMDFDLCHFPALGPREGDDRYPWAYPPISETYNIHGHTHEPYRLHDGNQIHIGVDAWDFTPVSTGQIFDLIYVP